MKNRSAKRAKFEEFMAGDHTLVHLDSRKPGVEVPANLSGNPALTLKLSYLFQGETTVDEVGIKSYLKFSGNYVECVIPWDSVWGLTSSEGTQITWPEDLPKELVIQLAKEQLSKIGAKLFGKKEKAAPTKEQQSAPATPDHSPQGKGSHLKRVK